MQHWLFNKTSYFTVCANPLVICQHALSCFYGQAPQWPMWSLGYKTGFKGQILMSPRYWAWLEVGEVIESSLLFSTIVALVLNLPFLKGFVWDAHVLGNKHVLCLNHLCSSRQRASVKPLWLLWLPGGTGESCSSLLRWGRTPVCPVLHPSFLLVYICNG